MKQTVSYMVIILGLSLLAGAASAAPGTLVFADQAKVDKSMVNLMDLVSPESQVSQGLRKRLSNQPVMRAPTLGRTLNVASSKVRGALLAARMPRNLTVLIPQRIRVIRDSQRLDASRIADIYKKALIRRLGKQADRVDIHDVQVSRSLTLPAGRIETRVDFLSGRLAGQVPAYIDVLVDGKRVHRLRVTALVDRYTNVVVAAQGLRRGQIIQADDLQVTTLNVSEIKGHVASQPDDLIGMRTRSTVGFGQPVLLRTLERTPLIRRGDVVTMIVKAPGLFVRAKGKAEQTGFKNGRIRLVNLATKKKVFGKVLNAGTVLVNL
jgi:flagella basal body P-ring formation protein FlgA